LKHDGLATLALAVLLGALVYLGCRQVLILERIDAQREVHVLPQGAIMSRSQTWRYLDSEGHLQSHTTTTIYRDAAHPAETKAEWKARFEAEVAADEAIYPPAGS